MKYFDLEFESTKEPDEVMRETITSWTGPLAANGYTLTSQSDIAVTYHRKYRHWFVIVLAIFFFPIGLLFLLITDDATITATVERDDETGGTALIINGNGSKNVRKGFEALEV
jgi:hypothetical protein